MTRGLRLVVIGKQGSGKGTLCVRLSAALGIGHLSTGDALRAAIANRTKLGARAQAYVASGRLVPDELVMQVVDERFVEADLRARGFLFDGFPRTVSQAESLDALLAPDGVDAVVYLEVDDAVSIARIATRRVCQNPDCGATYSVDAPPRRDWTCDRCGSAVVQREDDREEVVLRRLEAYKVMTAPVIERYELAGRLVRIDASARPDEVFAATMAALCERGLQSPERIPGR